MHATPPPARNPSEPAAPAPPATPAAKDHAAPGHMTEERAVREVLTLRRSLRKIWVLIAGTVVIIVGIIISPLPGPGFTILGPIGLAMIASEFAWARKLLKDLQSRATFITEQTDSLGKQSHPVIATLVVIGYWVLVWWMAREIGGIGSKVVWAVSFPLFTPVGLWAWAAFRFRGGSMSKHSDPASKIEVPKRDSANPTA
jgi:uncharacterized protein (TIGR02611 family)